jgi:hypothetical protein
MQRCRPEKDFRVAAAVFGFARNGFVLQDAEMRLVNERLEATTFGFCQERRPVGLAVFPRNGIDAVAFHAFTLDALRGQKIE